MIKKATSIQSLSNEFFRFRGECCNILAALFCEPETGVHDNKELYELLEDFSSKTKLQVSGYAAKLSETASSININHLKIEYTRLFLGPFGALAYPYSSMYTHEKLLMGDSTMWVIDFYKKAGFQIDADLFEPPDHIVFELQFLYMLAYNATTDHDNNSTTDSLPNYKMLFCDFVTQHMLKWVPEFCHSIIINTNSIYYKQLASLLRALVVACDEETI